MSELLIVQGEDAAAVRYWYGRGLAAYRSIAGSEPFDSIAEDGRSVAVFARRKSPVGIVRSPSGPEGPAWVCGAGVWFYEGMPGETGLRRIARAASPESPEAWLRLIDGAFVIAQAGREPGELVLATDRLGSLHVYEARADATVLLCTSSLVLAALLRPQWNPAGVRHFLSTGTIFERHTLYVGIEKLPPASVFRYRWGQGEPARKYWSVAAASYESTPTRGGVESVAAGLRQAMATIAAGYPDAALDITGGYDSRGLVGAMLQEKLRFHTVVVGSPSDPDVIVAGRIAQEFGLSHERRDQIRLSPESLWDRAKQAMAFTDGEYDVLLYANVLEAHLELSRRFGASINGSNGEILKGQWWEILLPNIGGPKFDARAVAAARFAFGEPTGLLAFDYAESLVDDFAAIIRRATAGMEAYPNTALLDCVYLTLRMQRWQGRLMSGTNRVWPTLSPYAFREPMEMALATPTRERVRHRLSRRLIEHQSHKLASLPLAQGYPALPVRWNTLHRFWPLAQETAHVGVRAGMRLLGLKKRTHNVVNHPFARVAHLEEVRDLLDPDRLRTRDLYRPSAVRAVLERAMNGGGAADVEVAGRVLTIELAHRTAEGATAL